MGEAQGNATKAALLAGYSQRNARPQGSRLLTKANIQAAISQRQADDPQVWTREQRQRFWTAVASGQGEYAAAALKDRLKASELLGKAGADFVERHEHTGKDGAPIKVIQNNYVAAPPAATAGAPAR